MDEDLPQTREAEVRAPMTAGLAGDAAAFPALLERLSGDLPGYFKWRFLRIGHGSAEAEDLVQEVLIAIHTHRDTYDRAHPFTPWLHAIARYKFLDYLRRTKPSLKNIPVEDSEELMTYDDQVGVESEYDLEKLMAGISPKTRQAIQYVKI